MSLGNGLDLYAAFMMLVVGVALLEARGNKNHSIGYLKRDSGPSKPLYYVQRNAMDWILDRECVRVARGSTMGELQEVAEREEQKTNASIGKELLHDTR
jgi:hypothetical protein